MAAIGSAGYKAGKDIFVALDPAASGFLKTAPKENKFLTGQENIILKKTGWN